MTTTPKLPEDVEAALVAIDIGEPVVVGGRTESPAAIIRTRLAWQDKRIAELEAVARRCHDLLDGAIALAIGSRVTIHKTVAYNLAKRAKAALSPISQEGKKDE